MGIAMRHLLNYPPFIGRWVGEAWGTGRGPMFRAWTTEWVDAVDPPTQRAGENIAFLLANHWNPGKSLKSF